MASRCTGLQIQVGGINADQLTRALPCQRTGAQHPRAQGTLELRGGRFAGKAGSYNGNAPSLRFSSPIFSSRARTMLRLMLSRRPVCSWLPWQ